LKIFEFSNNVIDKVLKEIESAEVFIKIAVFQIHLDRLFDLLEQKADAGLEIDILTLPYDSINDPVRDDVSSRLNHLSDVGVNLHFCKWNVGDPERTTTAIGRWYSFHGKFIVTDKSAIALSANFTRDNELDASIIIKNEHILIDNFVSKFNELLELFVTEHEGYEGTIRSKITNSDLNNIDAVFDLPSVIQTTTHQNFWIKHYPSTLCPDEIEIEEKLYAVPFDIKGRNIYEKILNSAESYIYISAESFTDQNFSSFLRQLKFAKSIDICLLVGFTSMDFSDRIQKMFRELIADDIDLYSLEDNLHAKLIITDKHLLIGSINLNKMNLGFNLTRKFWRENTETFFVTTSNALIQTARTKFENQINNSIRMEVKLAEKVQGEVTKILNKSFNVSTKKEVKVLFSKFVLMKEIDVKRDLTKLIRITKKIMILYEVRVANKDTFVKAIILFYLQDRKHTRQEIEDKLNKLEPINNLDTLLEELVNSGLIEIEEDYYKINIEALFG